MRFHGVRKRGWLALAALMLAVLAWIWPGLGQASSGRLSVGVLELSAALLALAAVACLWEFFSSRLLNYAELGETELKVVSGLRRNHVSYSAITGIGRKRADVKIRGVNVEVRGVVVEAGEKKLFVEAQDASAFIDELRKRCPQAR